MFVGMRNVHFFLGCLKLTQTIFLWNPTLKD